MCRDKNNDKNKTNLPPPPSAPVIVFIIVENLLSLWLLNFQPFNLLFLTVL